MFHRIYNGLKLCKKAATSASIVPGLLLQLMLVCVWQMFLGAQCSYFSRARKYFKLKCSYLMLALFSTQSHKALHTLIPYLISFRNCFSFQTPLNRTLCFVSEHFLFLTKQNCCVKLQNPSTHPNLFAKKFMASITSCIQAPVYGQLEPGNPFQNYFL